MSLEFLLVHFPEERAVTADGDNVGWTNRLILLAPDDYRIAMSGTDYTPSFVDITLGGTSAATPKVIVFRPASDAPPMEQASRQPAPQARRSKRS